jgi:hypothetical protein
MSPFVHSGSSPKITRSQKLREGEDHDDVSRDRVNWYELAQSVIMRLDNSDEPIVDIFPEINCILQQRKFTTNEFMNIFTRVSENFINRQTVWVRKCKIMEIIDLPELAFLLSETWQQLALICLLESRDLVRSLHRIVSSYSPDQPVDTQKVKLVTPN